jgi:hypothetical protein
MLRTFWFDTVDPFRELTSLQQWMDQTLQQTLNSFAQTSQVVSNTAFVPKAEVFEADEQVALKIEVPVTGKGSPACICFRDDEQPFFRTSEERDVAAQLQCPLHGARFDIRRTMHIYVAKWRWENEVNWRRPRLSTQYHKAWQASLPPEPGESPFSPGILNVSQSTQSGAKD